MNVCSREDMGKKQNMLPLSANLASPHLADTDSWVLLNIEGVS